MMFLRISSKLPKRKLLELAGSRGVLLLNPKKTGSLQSLELAHYLAKSAFRDRHNIAKKFPLEFLLWLAGKKDITSALDETTFADSLNIIAVYFGNEADRREPATSRRDISHSVVSVQNASAFCISKTQRRFEYSQIGSQRTAGHRIQFGNKKDFKKLLRDLLAREKPLRIKQDAGALEIERISLSRI